MTKNILALLILISTTVSAQVSNNAKIKGKIVNTEGSPSQFTETILTNRDSTIVKNTFTNESGNFEVEVNKGIYIFQIKQSNKIVYFRNIELNTSVDLGVIAIHFSNELENVTIVSKKKVIERKVDRLIFNVENSISASGGDALDALSVTPGLRVQNDKLTVIGKSNLAVMIDDKIVNLTEEDLSNYLKSIPADAIKSIEVFTTPPAKYEATGNSGLVNIKLKKAKKDS